VPFFTAETDESLAAAARELFRADENVHVLEGDWHEVLPPEAPFDLVFHDAAKQQPELDGEDVLGLLAPRGLVVLDDLTPGREGPDPVREFWLGHRDLAAAEVSVSPSEAVVLAVRTK
jgi:predicted O-methyltransferase YrrM